jgi:hypothetical protein
MKILVEHLISSDPHKSYVPIPICGSCLGVASLKFKKQEEVIGNESSGTDQIDRKLSQLY